MFNPNIKLICKNCGKDVIINKKWKKLYEYFPDVELNLEKDIGFFTCDKCQKTYEQTNVFTEDYTILT